MEAKKILCSWNPTQSDLYLPSQKLHLHTRETTILVSIRSTSRVPSSTSYHLERVCWPSSTLWPFRIWKCRQKSCKNSLNVYPSRVSKTLRAYLVSHVIGQRSNLLEHSSKSFAISREVKMYKTCMMKVAISFACLQEEKLNKGSRPT